MTLHLWIAWLLACTGIAPPTDTGTPPTPTGVTGHTGDTAAETLEFERWVWEDDRACWALLTTVRPADAWAGWLAEACQLSPEDTSTIMSDADGFCGRWPRPFEVVPGWGDCRVDDPWIRPCSDVAGCCDHSIAGQCVPPYYEP